MASDKFAIISLIIAMISILITYIMGSFIAKALALPEKSGERFQEIDGLRGILSICVVLHHAWIWINLSRQSQNWSAPPENFANQLGSGAVAMFFMITGFLFYDHILNKKNFRQWFEFGINRIFRILPLVIASVALVTLVITYRTGNKISSTDAVPLLIWISSIGEPPIAGYSNSGQINAFVLWSLRWEWVFYFLLMPTISLVLKNRNENNGNINIIIILCLLLLVWSAKFVAVHLLSEKFATDHGVYLGLLFSKILSKGLLNFIPLFLIGMLAREFSKKNQIRKIMENKIITGASFLGLLYIMTVESYPYGFALPFFSTFFISLACGGNIFGLFSTPAARLLGECSFGIYLMHGIVLSIAFTEGRLGDVYQTSIAGLALGILGLFPIILTISLVGHFFVERPFIRIGKNIAAWIRSSEV